MRICESTEHMTSDKLRADAERALRFAEAATNEDLRQELLKIAAEFLKQNQQTKPCRPSRTNTRLRLVYNRDEISQEGASHMPHTARAFGLSSLSEAPFQICKAISICAPDENG